MLETFLVLALKVLNPRKPLSPVKARMVGHRIRSTPGATQPGLVDGEVREPGILLLLGLRVGFTLYW